MRIAIDVDNILNNLQMTVVDMFNEKYGTNYTINDFDDYNIENVLPLQEAIDMKELYASEDIYNHVKPIVGSQEGLRKLLTAGHEVYLVTDAIPKNYYNKIQWIKNFFPFIDESHIVSMRHKWLFKADIMIEDNAENLTAGTHYHRICLDYKWNRKVRDWVYGIHRCSNWNEIVSVVNKLSKEE